MEIFRKKVMKIKVPLNKSYLKMCNNTIFASLNKQELPRLDLIKSKSSKWQYNNEKSK